MGRTRYPFTSNDNISVSSLVPIEAFLSGKYKIDDMIVLDLYSDLVSSFFMIVIVETLLG